MNMRFLGISSVRQPLALVTLTSAQLRPVWTGWLRDGGALAATLLGRAEILVPGRCPEFAFDDQLARVFPKLEITLSFAPFFTPYTARK